MKYLFILLLFPVCGYGQVTLQQKTEVVEKKEEIKTVKAQVLQIQGTNKAGRPLPGDGDFFLEFGGDKYFVKLSESKIKRETLNKYIGKKVQARLHIREGLWDTDDPNVQSRIGKYVALIEILER